MTCLQHPYHTALKESIPKTEGSRAHGKADKPASLAVLMGMKGTPGVEESFKKNQTEGRVGRDAEMESRDVKANLDPR